MKSLAGVMIVLGLSSPILGQDVAEPRTGARFPVKAGGMSLLGVGLRTKTFLKVKVYAVGFYVSDGALAGPLAKYKERTDAQEFYKDLVWGDFEKEIRLRFVRDVTQGQIQGAFREALGKADQKRVDSFAFYFGDTKEGQEYSIRWAAGGTLETAVAGQQRPPIPDKTFAAAVFGIWLGEKPIQEDIKRALASRAIELLH